MTLGLKVESEEVSNEVADVKPGSTFVLDESNKDRFPAATQIAEQLKTAVVQLLQKLAAMYATINFISSRRENVSERRQA